MTKIHMNSNPQNKSNKNLTNMTINRITYRIMDNILYLIQV